MIHKKKNETYIRSLPCLVTGRPFADVAHFPIRRSQGGKSTLLNMIPLSREWHRRVDNYEEPYRSIVFDLAEEFHKRIAMMDFSKDDLGEQWWV